MDDLKRLAAVTALNDMFKKGYLSICTIDTIGKMMNVDPKGEPYRLLSTLHCVHFAEMPQELKEAIPGLIEKCLMVAPTFQFPQPKRVAVDVVYDVPKPGEEVEPRKRGFLRMLTR